MNKQANTSVSIHELIANRWSPRALDAKKPIAEKDLLAVLEAAHWAPSCFGDQPWRFIVCNRFSNEKSWNKALACLAEKNQLWAKNSAVLIIAVASQTFSQNGNPNRWAEYDTGAASENLCLQATALGFYAHQMGGFDQAAIINTFSIPEKFNPIAVIALGHLADAKTLDKDFYHAEIAERQRNAIDDHFFIGKWGSL